MKRQNEQHWFRRAMLAPGALKQLGAILATSCVLGLAFNASNPIGIRWSEPEAASGNETGVVASPAEPPGDAPVVGRPELPTDGQVPAATEIEGAPVPVETTVTSASYIAPSPTTWEEVQPRHEAGKMVLVDARTRAEFDAGHIPNALWLPYPPSPEEMQAFRAEYDTDTHVVIYCSSTSCSVSYKLAHRLAKDEGYEFVQYMTGGYLAYQRALNVASAGVTDSTLQTAVAHPPAGPPPSPGGPESASGDPVPPSERPLDNALPINWVHTKPLLAIGQVFLLDVRPGEQFDAGHIPGARSLRFDAERAEIERVLKDRAASVRVVTYCGRMGCPEAFRLANRLLHEFKVRNVWFMVEGYEDWRQSERSADGAGA